MYRWRGQTGQFDCGFGGFRVARGQIDQRYSCSGGLRGASEVIFHKQAKQASVRPLPHADA